MIKQSNNIGKFYGLLIIGFIIMVAIGIILQNKKINNYEDIREINYLTGVLVKIQAERSSAFGHLSNGRKIFFFDSENYNYVPYALNKFLKVGDSIVKHSQSDTLFVYRGTNKYYFLSGKSIGVKK